MHRISQETADLWKCQPGRLLGKRPAGKDQIQSGTRTRGQKRYGPTPHSIHYPMYK